MIDENEVDGYISRIDWAEALAIGVAILLVIACVGVLYSELFIVPNL